PSTTHRYPPYALWAAILSTSACAADQRDANPPGGGALDAQGDRAVLGQRAGLQAGRHGYPDLPGRPVAQAVVLPLVQRDPLQVQHRRRETLVLQLHPRLGPEIPRHAGGEVGLDGLQVQGALVLEGADLDVPQDAAADHGERRAQDLPVAPDLQVRRAVEHAEVGLPVALVLVDGDLDAVRRAGMRPDALGAQVIPQFAQLLCTVQL